MFLKFSWTRAVCLLFVIAEIVNSVPAPPLSHEYNITIINYSSKLKKPTAEPAKCTETEVEVPEEPSAEAVTKNSEEDSSYSFNVYEDIVKYMNDTVDPCDDFYEYACGNFATEHADSVDFAKWDMDSIANDVILLRLANILKDDDTESTTDSKEKSENGDHDENGEHEEDKSENGEEDHNEETQESGLDKVKALYKKCSDLEQRKEDGIEPLKEFIESLGGWHLLDGEWNEDEFDWIKLIAKLAAYDIRVLLSYSIANDDKKPGNRLIMVDTPFKYECGDLDLENEDIMEAQKEYVSGILKAIGIDEEVVEEVCDEIMEFTLALSKLGEHDSNEDQEETSTEQLTFKELQREISGIDWRQYFYIVFGKRLNSRQHVSLSDKKLIEDLSELISETDSKIVANYIYWKLVESSVTFLDDRFTEVQLQFAHGLTGAKQMEHPEKEAISFLAQHFHATLIGAYLEANHNHIDKEDVEEIAEEVKEALTEMIDENEWMDRRIKNAAKKKIDSIDVQIAYEDMQPSESAMARETDDLELSGKSCFADVMEVKKNSVKLSRTYLDNKIDDWNIPVLTEQPFYVHGANIIYVPVSSLIYPYYIADAPKSFLFGTLGKTIAGKLIYAFNEVGRSEEVSSRLVNSRTKKAIKKHMDCYVQQYDEYEIYDEHVRGNESVHVNILESEGLRIAYNAYQKWLSKNNEDEDARTISNLPLEDKQIFFLASAYQTCGHMTPEATVLLLKRGGIIPQFTVTGAVSNSDDFADAFSCTKGSSMNPEDKCQIL